MQKFSFRYLHSEDYVYQESASHHAQVKAYLNSWLRSALPIFSYDCEWILHGAVGYLLNMYVEDVFGEEAGKYRQQRLADAVVELDKSGRGYPLASYYPESYDVSISHTHGTLM